MSIAMREASTRNVVRLKIGDRIIGPEQAMQMAARNPERLARTAAGSLVIQATPQLIDTLRANGFAEIVKPTGEVETHALGPAAVGGLVLGAFLVGVAVGYYLGSKAAGGTAVDTADDGQHAGDTGDGPRDGDSGDGPGGSGDGSGSSGGGGSGG